MANPQNFLIAGNDEHGQNPPTAGKRTPVMPYIGRSFYENEFNRPAKQRFLAACVRLGFRVYDVKPELQDISVSQRVRRVNAQGCSFVLTFGYNASQDPNFNSANGSLCDQQPVPRRQPHRLHLHSRQHRQHRHRPQPRRGRALRRRHALLRQLRRRPRGTRIYDEFPRGETHDGPHLSADLRGGFCPGALHLL